MAFVKLRRWVITGLAAVCIAGIGAIAPSSPAFADTGGCPDRPHGVHTSDTAPFRAWACWIDDGDKIRVCDNAPNDGVHAHADLWVDLTNQGTWLQIVGEDDGPDDGCDDQGFGGLDPGTYPLRLRVCAQRTDQTNFACNNHFWWESEA